MKFRSLVVAIVFTLGSAAASAGSVSTPALLDGINNGVKVLEADQSSEIRGEYFYTASARDSFCRYNASKCDVKGYKSSAGMYYAKDVRRFMTDVFYAY